MELTGSEIWEMYIYKMFGIKINEMKRKETVFTFYFILRIITQTSHHMHSISYLRWSEMKPREVPEFNKRLMYGLCLHQKRIIIPIRKSPLNIRTEGN